MMRQKLEAFDLDGATILVYLNHVFLGTKG